ncbi:hypothetical protein O6H91_17G056100 [Diphasiastrum complanatum]|uniref:Uncharacterized protein n=1 Tax=Diphasiastrum complanatum TaxID=34168 RepID=A0ACC2B725_DIPCM|nr:hypothetical protein O6H91_17G056100 [Diphasiastrum complanatum]
MSSVTDRKDFQLTSDIEQIYNSRCFIWSQAVCQFASNLASTKLEVSTTLWSTNQTDGFQKFSNIIHSIKELKDTKSRWEQNTEASHRWISARGTNKLYPFQIVMANSHNFIKLKQSLGNRMRQKEALEEMASDCDLQALMEARLADLKGRMHEMTLELQRKHQEEKMKLKERIQKEREEFLQEHLTVRTELENKAKAAKEETNRLKTETDSNINKECVVCYFKFGADKLRAYFEACGHANVCIQCADEMWQFKNKACPTCKAAQKRRPTKFPVNIYL